MQAVIALIVAEREVDKEGESFLDKIARFEPLVKDFVPTLDDIKAAHIADDVFEMTNISGVTVITDWYFVKAYMAKLGSECMWEAEYAETGAVLKLFQEQNSCSYYAAPKEDYNIGEAVSQALKEGKKYVIVENMS